MTPFVELASGCRFTPLAPAVRDIYLRDIAHALSNQCRFGGHTRSFYSVAEHSVRVSSLLEEWGEDRGVQLWGLLHDASEAYLVDVPAPLKRHEAFGAYREAEAGVMRAVCARYGLPERMPIAVRLADETLLATEARDLMPYRPGHWGDLRQRPLPNPIQPWEPSSVMGQFLARYAEVSQ